MQQIYPLNNILHVFYSFLISFVYTLLKLDRFESSTLSNSICSEECYCCLVELRHDPFTSQRKLKVLSFKLAGHWLELTKL